MDNSLCIRVGYSNFSSEYYDAFDTAIKELLINVIEQVNLNPWLVPKAAKHFHDFKTEFNYIEVFLKDTRSS